MDWCGGVLMMLLVGIALLAGQPNGWLNQRRSRHEPLAEPRSRRGLWSPRP
jgi:hypothetical protein